MFRETIDDQPRTTESKTVAFSTLHKPEVNPDALHAEDHRSPTPWSAAEAKAISPSHSVSGVRCSMAPTRSNGQPRSGGSTPVDGPDRPPIDPDVLVASVDRC